VDPPIHLPRPAVFLPMSKETGEKLRDHGIDAALQNTPGAYRSKADEILLMLAQHGQPFTVEDLRSRAGDPPDSCPGTMGALISAALNRGLVRATGYVKARRPSSHHRMLRTYVGA
jgi:hypothetical protein